MTESHTSVYDGNGMWECNSTILKKRQGSSQRDQMDLTLMTETFNLSCDERLGDLVNDDYAETLSNLMWPLQHVAIFNWETSHIVSYAAVLCLVTQRSSPRWVAWRDKERLRRRLQVTLSRFSSTLIKNDISKSQSVNLIRSVTLFESKITNKYMVDRSQISTVKR